MTTPSDEIHLAGPVIVNTDTGETLTITAIRISREDHCCDISVHVPGGSQKLADDEAFLVCVNAVLGQAGYVGPALGRAEWGAQGPDCIVLEATDAFQAFAVTKGWCYAEGMDAWEAGKLLRTLPYAGNVTFVASNGAMYGVPVAFIAEQRAEQLAGQHGGVAPALRDVVLPALRSTPGVAAEWLRSDLPWDVVARVVRVITKPQEVDVKAEFAQAKLDVRGMGAKSWRAGTVSAG